MTIETPRRTGTWTGADVACLLWPAGLALAVTAGAQAHEPSPPFDGDYLPRIHFRGQFVCNSGTGNNNDVWSQWFDPDTVELFERFKRMTNEEIRERQLFQPDGPTSEYNAGWNLYGDHSTFFIGAAIAAVRRADGKTTTDDPLVGQFVNIIGDDGNFPVIVMPNPQGGIESQLFVGGFTIGDSPKPGVGPSSALNTPVSFALRASHDTRAYSRWIAQRNWAPYHGEHNGFMSCVWQFHVPAHRVHDVNATEGSVLQDLVNAAEKHDGLLVQWSSFLLEPTLSNLELKEKFDNLEFVANPAVGVCVGSILVKRNEGDFDTIVNGRRLQPPPFDAPPPPDSVLNMATVTVDTGNKEVTLNLVNGIPEDGYEPPYKTIDIGDIYLGVYKPDEGEEPEDARPIGVMTHAPSSTGATPSYGYETYEATGGIVDFSYRNSMEINDALLAEGRLVLYTLPTIGFQLWLEEPELTILSDDHVSYLDLVESPDPPDQVDITLELSAPAEVGTMLYFWEYQYVVVDSETPQLNITRQRVGEHPDLVHKLEFPEFMPVPEGHTSVVVTVKAIGPGPATLAYALENKPPPNGCDFAVPTGFYSRFRVLPHDDFSKHPMEERVMPGFVYEHVFRYYEVIFPAMGEKIIHFGAPGIMDNGAQGLLYRTEPGFWPSTLYMPRTRALSPGKQALIREWANSVQPP